MILKTDFGRQTEVGKNGCVQQGGENILDVEIDYSRIFDLMDRKYVTEVFFSSIFFHFSSSPRVLRIHSTNTKTK